MVLLSQHILTFSRHFRDIFETMSLASRSHRGRFRRMTVSFEHCFHVLTCKVNIWGLDFSGHFATFFISYN